jgi:hypothetical protein
MQRTPTAANDTRAHLGDYTASSSSLFVTAMDFAGAIEYSCPVSALSALKTAEIRPVGYARPSPGPSTTGPVLGPGESSSLLRPATRLELKRLAGWRRWTAGCHRVRPYRVRTAAPDRSADRTSR